MARKFPRFLFDESEGVKSPGIYIVHLLKPRLLFKFSKDPKEIESSELVFGPGAFKLILIDDIPQEITASKLNGIIQDAFNYAVNRMAQSNVYTEINIGTGTGIPERKKNDNAYGISSHLSIDPNDIESY